MGEGDASGVTDAGGAEIGDSGAADAGIRGEGVEEEIVEESGEKSGRAQLVPKVERQRALQRRVRQYRRVQVARKRRLRLRIATRLGLYLSPHPSLLIFRLLNLLLLLGRVHELASGHTVGDGEGKQI